MAQPLAAQPARETPASVVAKVETAEPVDYVAKPELVSMTTVLFYCAALSPDGAWVAGGTSDWTKPGELLLWDVATRKLKFKQNFGLGVRSVAFSSDNRLLAAGTFTNEVLLVDVAKGAVLARWQAHTGAVNGLAFSPDGKLLATGSLDHGVKLWDVTIPKTAKEALPLHATLVGHTDWVFTVAFGADGKSVFSAGKDQKVFVWDVEKKQASATWDNLPSVVENLTVSPDGETIALGMWNGTIEIRKIADGSSMTRLLHSTTGAVVGHVSFAKSGKYLGSAATDGSIKVWELTEGKVVTAINAHQGKAWAAMLTSDGSQVMSAGTDGLLRMWDTKSSNKIFEVHRSEGIPETDGPIVASTWSRDRSILITAHPDGTVRIRRPQTGVTLKVAKKILGPQGALALSPDGKRVAAVGRDKVVAVWDITGEIGEPVLFNGHMAPATSVVFSPDGKWIFSGAADGVIRQWDANTGAAGLVLEAGKEKVIGLECSADGNWLAAGQGRTVQLWNLNKLERQPAMTLRGHLGTVSALAFAAKPTLLASAADDNTVLLWNLGATTSGSEPAAVEIPRPRHLAGHEAAITCLAFSPQGNWLVSGSLDKTVRFWSPRTGKPGQVLKSDFFIHSLAFSPDAVAVMGVGRDKVLRTWRGHPVIPFATKEGRYIKLKSLSEVTGGPCTVVAEIRVTHEAGLVPNRQWKLVSADSAVNTLPATLAFDGKQETHWHTPYLADVTQMPHEIIIDLGRNYRLNGLSVLNRIDVWYPNGTIKDYEFYVGNDPNNFGSPVSKGRLTESVAAK